MDRPGGIFVRTAEQMSVEDRILQQSVARAIITDSRGTLADQINRVGPAEALVPPLQADPHASFRRLVSRRDAPTGSYLLQRARGILHGWARVCHHDRARARDAGAMGQCVGEPALWNRHLGERLAYTWSENAHEFRLTPWHNDPVSDASGEALYLRDEESGHFWSPTPLPSRGTEPYVSRHGFGYSVFEHTESGIRSELWVYVAMDALDQVYGA